MKDKAREEELQIAETKMVMSDNIEKVLDRGEKIELLVDKTEQLRFTADNFSKSGKKLRRHMWCQNLKMKVSIDKGQVAASQRASRPEILGAPQEMARTLGDLVMHSLSPTQTTHRLPTTTG